MNNVLIHFKTSYLDQIKKFGYDYKIVDNEVDVIVPNLDYDYNHSVMDPDEQLCYKLGLDYDQVNCIELVS